MPRGRKSAASVEVTPMLPGSGRPEPPASLSPVEARCWRDVIDALPGFWVDIAGQLILRRLAILCTVVAAVCAAMGFRMAYSDFPGHESIALVWFFFAICPAAVAIFVAAASWVATGWGR